MAAVVTKTFCDTTTNLGGRLRGMGTSSVEESNSDSVGRISWLRPLLLDWLTVRDHTCCPQGHWRCGLLQRLTIIQQNIPARNHVRSDNGIHQHNGTRVALYVACALASVSRNNVPAHVWIG